MSFVVNKGALLIILTNLFERQLSFFPLLSFSLWSKQESHFSSWILVSTKNKSLRKIRPKECSVYIATKDNSFVKPYLCRRYIKIVSRTQGGPCII